MSAGFSFSEAAENHRVRVHLLDLARHPECTGLELNKQGLAPVLISSWESTGKGMPTGFSGTLEECCDSESQLVLPWKRNRAKIVPASISTNQVDVE